MAALPATGPNSRVRVERAMLGVAKPPAWSDSNVAPSVLVHDAGKRVVVLIGVAVELGDLGEDPVGGAGDLRQIGLGEANVGRLVGSQYVR